MRKRNKSAERKWILSSARCSRAIDNHLRARVNTLAYTHTYTARPHDYRCGGMLDKREKSDVSRRPRNRLTVEKFEAQTRERLEDVSALGTPSSLVLARVEPFDLFPREREECGVRSYLHKIFGQRAGEPRYIHYLLGLIPQRTRRHAYTLGSWTPRIRSAAPPSTSENGPEKISLWEKRRAIRQG